MGQRRTKVEVLNEKTGFRRIFFFQTGFLFIIFLFYIFL